MDRKVLTYALKGTSDQLSEHFFSTMSARAVEMLKDDMESHGSRQNQGSRRPRSSRSSPWSASSTTEGVITLKGTVGEQYVV